MSALLVTYIEDLKCSSSCCRYKCFCMSAHVLLNLLNELWKRDELRGCPRAFYLSFVLS